MKRMDMMIIGIVVLLAAMGVLSHQWRQGRPYDDRRIEIKVDGELVEAFEWTEGLERTIDIETDRGFNRIVVSEGRLWIGEADCPDQICVKDGPIDAPGEMLVCLPHRLIIEIKGVDRTEGVDDVSY